MLNINIVKILRLLFLNYLIFRSNLRLCILRLLGLKINKNVIIGKNNKFPILNLKNIKIYKNVCIGQDAWFFMPAMNRKCTIFIDEGVNIGSRFTIACNNSIKIGKNCLLSWNVSIIDTDHIFKKNLHPTTSGIGYGEPIEIGNDCFIGCNAVILKGVKLGNHCVVGANSVVTRSFPAGSILGGAPANIIKTLK